MNSVGGPRINDFGTKLSYDPEWKGPLNVKRKAENISFTVAYYLFVCLWIGVAIYARLTGDAEKWSGLYRETEDFIFDEAWILALVFALAAFSSILFLVLLRVAPKPIVYTSIAIIFVLLLAAVICRGFLLYFEQTKENFITFFVAIAMLIVIFLLFISKRKFIPMTCEIVRESSKAMLSFPLMFFYTLIYSCLTVLFILFDVSLFFWIQSIGTDDYYPAHLYVCHIINGWALIWILFHMDGIFRVSVAGAYGTWYWTTNKREVPRFTALRFIYIAIRYHIGPTAFGSLIIMVCMILQGVIEFVSSSSGFDAANGDPGVGLMHCSLACCKYAMYCIKAMAEAITNMSYVHVAHHGTGFMDAARVSFNLFKRNYAKVAVLKQITGMVCLTAVLTITGLSLLVFWGLLSTQSVKLKERIAVLVLLVVCIFLLICAILELLVIAVETIFICVLEDYEMNAGSNRPYHMSNKLKDLVLENRLE